MKLNIIKKLSEYNKGATGLNKAGLFARVAPVISIGKFGGGSLFSKTRFARQENI